MTKNKCNVMPASRTLYKGKYTSEWLTDMLSYCVMGKLWKALTSKMPQPRQGHVLHLGLDKANGPVGREKLFIALQDEMKSFQRWYKECIPK